MQFWVLTCFWIFLLNLKKLSRGSNMVGSVPLKIVFNVLWFKPALNWNRFLADLRRSSNSLNLDSGERNLNGFQTNTVGTINMLGLAKRTKARILIASTSEVICTVKTTHRSQMNPKKKFSIILNLSSTTIHCRSLPLTLKLTFKSLSWPLNLYLDL